MLKPSCQIVIAMFLITWLGACNFNSTYLNRESDKNDAQRVTEQYYSLLKSKNYEATYGLFSNEFWKVTSKEQLKKLYIATQTKLGDLKNTNLDHWETKVVAGTNPGADYIMYYANKYQKYKAEETLRLVKDTDGKIRIIAFHINSEGFLN